MNKRSLVLVSQNDAHTLWLNRFRDDPVSHLPTPLSMLLRMIATIVVAFSIALAITYFAPRIGV